MKVDSEKLKMYIRNNINKTSPKIRKQRVIANKLAKDWKLNFKIMQKKTEKEGKISVPQASGGKRLAWSFLLLACCGTSAKLLQLSEPQFLSLWG